MVSMQWSIAWSSAVFLFLICVKINLQSYFIKGNRRPWIEWKMKEKMMEGGDK